MLKYSYCDEIPLEICHQTSFETFLGVLPAHLCGSSIKHLLGAITTSSGSSRSSRTGRQVDVPSAKTPYYSQARPKFLGFDLSQHENSFPNIKICHKVEWSFFSPPSSTSMYSTNRRMKEFVSRTFFFIEDLKWHEQLCVLVWRSCINMQFFVIIWTHS